MTNEQRRSAWACVSTTTLKEWLTKYHVSAPRRWKKRIVEALANSDVEIPEEIYELWKSNMMRLSNTGVRDKVLETVRPKREDIAK